MSKMLPIGTRVRVTPITITHLDGTSSTDEPYNAVIVGYDMRCTKYRLDKEIWDGLYATGGHTWALRKEVAAAEGTT